MLDAGLWDVSRRGAETRRRELLQESGVPIHEADLLWVVFLILAVFANLVFKKMPWAEA